MKGFIYKITNRVNNKVYIGQTRFTIEHRWKQHLKNFNIEHRKQPLYNAFAKYGIENFSIEPIEQIEFDKLDEREKYWIAYFDSFNKGYNATIGGKGGAKYFWTDSQYEDIRNLYLSGFSVKYVAELFNISAYTITGLLRSMNIKIRKPLDLNKVETEILIKDYQNGFTLKSLAKQYKTSPEYLKKFLISKGVNINHRYMIMKDMDIHKNIISDFLDGMRYTEIESKYRTDTRTIKRILTINGINIKAPRGLRDTRKGAFCLTDEQCLEAIKMYNDNIYVKDIARKYKIDISTVYELLKRYHVKCNRYNHSTSVQTLTDNTEG